MFLSLRQRYFPLRQIWVATNKLIVHNNKACYVLQTLANKVIHMDVNNAFTLLNENAGAYEHTIRITQRWNIMFFSSALMC